MLKDLYIRFQATALLILLTAVQPIQAQSIAGSCGQWLQELHPPEIRLVSKENEILRGQAQEMSHSEILSSRTQALVDSMRVQMNFKGGIGIAAPQVGVDKKIIIAKQPKLLNSTEYILINPKFTPLTSETNWGIEGCLSVPGVCGFVQRFNSIRVDYQDLKGEQKTLEAKGDFARVLQHEIDHLNGILFTDKTLLKTMKEKKQLLAIRRSAPDHIKKFSEIVDESVEESFDPYSLSFDVRQLHSDLQSFKIEIESLLQHMLESQTSLQRAEFLTSWVRSEEHALFLYDLMNKTGLSKFSEELNYLQQNNIYFIESHFSGQSLVTYSFEKEGTSSDISLLFRPPTIPEQKWMEMSEEDRFVALKKVTIPKKTFTRASQIMPTQLKPNAVGGYSEELSDFRRKGYGWEISHKKYEINRQRLIREVRELSQIFKQTHSFQVHVVFELPHKYVKYENFIYWFKHLNDYLYLKGLEEGLHGNYLTGVANIASDLGWGDRISNWLHSFYSTSNTILESQKKLGRQNSKFFSAGLRAGIYGPASSKESMKIGIELRDTTRSVDQLDNFTELVSDGIANKSWEASDLAEIKKSGFRLTTNSTTAQNQLASVVSRKFAKLFAEVEPTSNMGLIQYEQSFIYDYKLNKKVEASEEVRNRIQQAREEYIHDLKALEIELTELEAKGEKTEKELIQAALRMSLSTWAKKARVAELFEKI